jgi:hypothetical protein
MVDLASKNELINKGVKDINKMVTEKYGGDWGRASKEVARQVTSIRTDPFWSAQAGAEKRRQAFQEQVTKYGPQAMVFGRDPRQVSTLDKYGEVRGPEAFTGEVIQQGKWGDTARRIFSTMTPDTILSVGLSDLDRGYLEAGKITKITTKGLQLLADNEDVQLAFQQAHPEFVRGFKEGDVRMKERFGIKGKTLKEATSKTLFGNIAPAAFEKRERQIVYDRQAAEARERAAVAGVRPDTTPSAIIGRDYEGKTKIKSRDFGPTGAILTAEERSARTAQEPSPRSLLPVFFPGISAPRIGVLLSKGWDEVQKMIASLSDTDLNLGETAVQQAGLTAISPGTLPLTSLKMLAKTATSIQDFMNKAQAEKDMAEMSLLREQNPNLADHTDAEIHSLTQSANEKLNQQSSRLYSYDPDWQDAATRNFIWDGKTRGRFFGQELFLDGQRMSGTRKEQMFAKELGYKIDSEAFKDALKETRISDMTYTGNTPGEMVASIIGKDGKQHTMEIAPMEQVQELATPSWLVTEYLRSGGNSPRLYDGTYKVWGQQPFKDESTGYTFIPVPATIEIEGENRQVWYAITGQVQGVGGSREDGEYDYEIVRAVFDPDGTPRLVGDPSDRPIQLEDIIAQDRSQVENWLKENKSQKTVRLGAGK